MSSAFQKNLQLYDYHLPPELVAQAPTSPRDSARLLVYHRRDKHVAYDIFLHLPNYLPKGAVLVFNDTKVIPARLTLKKPTGGLVRVLYLGHHAHEIEVLADRRITPLATLFLCHSRESRRHGGAGGNPDLGINLDPRSRSGMTASLGFTVTRQVGAHYFLQPSFPITQIFAVLEQYGQTPIPPYIKHSPLSEQKLREQYQTIFARTRGSVAAPTASLHFTKRLMGKIKKAGCEIQFVTLHVNLGTFAPLTGTQVTHGTLHKEYFEITKNSAAALNSAKREGRPIIAVGTTVTRTLESAANARGQLQKLAGTTDLFIREGYRFKFVDGLITNFHVPRSSLLMLVSALTGRTELFRLYQIAMEKRFRFFSFGDGMLIL